MNTLCNEFISLRYGTFKNICDMLSIVYSQSLKCDVDDISYICFHLVKRQNNKIICIGPDASIYDISQFHPSQIANMRIHYKSFNTEFNFNPISIKMINSEYINELRAIIKNIILEIIHNLNPFDYEKKHIYEDKMPNVVQFKKNDDDKLYEGYFSKNVQYYLNKIEESHNKIQKIKHANSVFNFINYNLDCITEHHKFAVTVMKKIIEIKGDVNDMMYNIINADHIVYDDVIICVNMNDSITKFTYNFKCKFDDIYKEVSQTQ